MIFRPGKIPGDELLLNAIMMLTKISDSYSLSSYTGNSIEIIGRKLSNFYLPHREVPSEFIAARIPGQSIS